jgi:hypothetical protein
MVLRRPDESTPNSWGQADNHQADGVIAAVANRQGGVVARQQLIARGISGKEIDYRISIGRLRVVHRGVYAVGVLSDVLCEVEVTDAALGAGKGHRDQAEEQDRGGWIASPRSAREFC